VGGSYPGAITAYFRYKFPHLTAGAWGSSAIIKGIANYVGYEEIAIESSMKYGVKCAENISRLSKYVGD